jgi:hypothetical protein
LLIFFTMNFTIKRFIILILFINATLLQAQSDADAIMMDKNNFCGGLMYMHSSWTNYWEGTLKRNNANLGSINTNAAIIMGNYGLKSNLNMLFALPYIHNTATAGQLSKQKGLQDISLWLKYMPFEKKVGPGILSLYGLLGYSTPVSNYSADFLPLSIGLQSKTTSLRAMIDYQYKSLSITSSYTYGFRENIFLDRMAYYTTQMHLTNEVFMPNTSMFQLRAGYRSSYLIAEVLFTQSNTLGGFDITRNNMPFASNRMNATQVGTNIKYTLKKIDGLSFLASTNFTVAGRNIGQSNAYGLGAVYIVDFSAKQKSSNSTN